MNECARLRSIRLTALQDAPQAFETTFQTAVTFPFESWQQQLQNLPTFVAVVNDVDSGMVRGAPHPDDPNSAYLISLWVAPKARGLGIGQALIEVVVAWAGSEKYARLVLEVAEANGSAISLYIRIGFKPTGQTRTLAPPRDHIREQEMVLDL